MGRVYRSDQGSWYGWPDFGCDVPVTDQRFQVPNTPRTTFRIANHPTETPPRLVAKFRPHEATNGLPLARQGRPRFPGGISLLTVVLGAAFAAVVRAQSAFAVLSRPGGVAGPPWRSQRANERVAVPAGPAPAPAAAPRSRELTQEERIDEWRRRRGSGR